MQINCLYLGDKPYPKLLSQIPDPPKQLFWAGEELSALLKQPCVAIVGSRKVTSYGRAITEKLAAELAGLGITIISGLAFGVDSIAHEAALSVSGKTIAVLPRGLDQIYPASHRPLANKIIDSGGALVTEYPEGSDLQNFQFLARNRIISGLSLGVIVTEAAKRSGSLNTANSALEQSREVMAIPGNITSPLSAGTNNLIKLGATPILSYQDVLDTLKLKFEPKLEDLLKNTTEIERLILSLISEGVADSGTLLIGSQLEPTLFNQTMTMLELNGRIKNSGNDAWRLQ